MHISYSWHKVLLVSGFFALCAIAASVSFASSAFAVSDDHHDTDGQHSTTVVATKIVCASEADLPNYGAGGPDITATTATDYVAAHPNCHLQSGWQFQWAPHAASNPGNNGTTPAGNPWKNFSLTNGSGQATAILHLGGNEGDDENEGGSIWVREVLQSGYVPFSGWLSNGHNVPTTNDKVSAEIYCAKDVLNYDNFDKVTVAGAHTYYCVAFNAHKTGTLTIVKDTVGADGSFNFGVHQGEVVATSTTIKTTDHTGSKVITLPVGSYDVLENIPEGWNLSNVACHYDEDEIGSPIQNGETVSILANENVTCTFTNTLNHGTVTIIKNVDNTAGGTATADNFHYSLNGGQATAFSTDPQGVTVNVPNGAYTVAETDANTNNYTTVLGAGCTGTMNPGDADVCTVTNTYVPPAPQCDENADTTFVSDATTADDSGATVVINPSDLNPGILPGAWATIPGASWIWSEKYLSDDTTVAKTEKFTKTFSITGSVNAGSIDLSTDNGYVLIVNGTTVDTKNTDPTDETNYNSVHTYDITSLLHTGSNTVEIDVTNFGRPETTFANNPGGLIYKIDVHANTCVQSSCVLPNTDNKVPFTFGTSPNEMTLQAMLAALFPSLDAVNDNTDTTSWVGDGSHTANFTATFINRVAGASTVFGYYPNGGAFVPLFTEGANQATPASQSFSIPSFSNVVFGIQATFNNTTNTFTTQPTDNADGQDHATVYHPALDTYALGFEDLSIPGADKDYNDMAVQVHVDSCTLPDTTATLSAEKIVCPTESELPNWGNGAADITATTASDFLKAHPDCHLAPWTFEFAPDGTHNPGDQTGVAGGAWTAFTTDVQTLIATAHIPAGALTWVREQFKPGYIPFSGSTSAPRDNVSAEMYCNTDVLNYDNYDWVNPVVAGHTYYCVAFNVPTSEGNGGGTTADVTVTKDVNDSSPDVNTNVTYTLTAVNNSATVAATGVVVTDVLPTGLTYVSNDAGATYDSGTHTLTWTVGTIAANSNAVLHMVATVTTTDAVDNTAVISSSNDANTDDNSGTVEVTATGASGSSQPQCSDGIDNDGDGVADVNDPGCHTGNNLQNPYNPSDNDESNSTDTTVTTTGGGGGGGPIGGGGGGGGGGNGIVAGASTGPVGEVLGASCGLYMNQHLRFGSNKNSKDQVMKLQTFLNKWLKLNPPLVVNGVFGPLTLTAVKTFQGQYLNDVLTPWGINAPTGLVYLSTLYMINKLECPDLAGSLPNLVPWSQNPHAQ